MNPINSFSRRDFFKTIGIVLLATGCNNLKNIPEGCTLKIDNCNRKDPIELFMVLYPPNYIGNPAPLCLYHGGMGETCNAPKMDMLKDDLIQDILNAGYIVASSSAHGNNWGNSASLTDYILLHEYVSHCHRITRTVLLSQSMGGCSGLLTLANRPFEIKGWAGIYPICNLRSYYYGDNEKLKSSLSEAYGISESGDDYSVKTIGNDPLLVPSESYAEVRMRFYASDEDTVVPKSSNTDLMHEKVKPFALESHVVDCRGDHGDPSHFQSDDLLAFFDRCL